MSDYDDFDSFEGDYKPSRGFAPDVTTLPPGKQFDFEITGAELKQPKAKRLCEVTLRCLSAEFSGQEFRYTWFLDTQQKLNWFSGDLAKLGFDSDRWGTANGRPLKVEIPKAVAALKGRRFRGGNLVSMNDGKEFTNFKVYVSLAPGAAPPPTSGVPVDAAAPNQEEDIPF